MRSRRSRVVPLASLAPHLRAHVPPELYYGRVIAHPSDPPADLSGVEKARFVDPNPFRNEK